MKIIPNGEKTMQMKILVIDDEREIIDMVVRNFTMHGYDIEGVTSPKKALEMIERGNYRIIISDIVMPEINGVDLIKKIKSIDGTIQIIMITGYVTIQNIVSCLSRGANDCLFKPFVFEELKNSVDESIRKLNRWHKVIESLNKIKV